MTGTATIYERVYCPGGIMEPGPLTVKCKLGMEGVSQTLLSWAAHVIVKRLWKYYFQWTRWVNNLIVRTPTESQTPPIYWIVGAGGNEVVEMIMDALALILCKEMIRHH
jgi:hypothetical protein